MERNARCPICGEVVELRTEAEVSPALTEEEIADMKAEAKKSDKEQAKSNKEEKSDSKHNAR